MASFVLMAAGVHGGQAVAAQQVPAGDLSVTVALDGDGVAGRGVSGIIEISADGVSWRQVSAFRAVLGLSVASLAAGAQHVFSVLNVGWVRVTTQCLTAVPQSFSVAADVV